MTSSSCSCPRSGETVTAGAVVGELESTKSVSEVYAPVGGEIVARNEALDATPELVNTDPYGEGWLFEIVAGQQRLGRPDGRRDLPGERRRPERSHDSGHVPSSENSDRGRPTVACR